MATGNSPILQSIEQSAGGSKWLELISKTFQDTSATDAFMRLGTLTLDEIRLDPIYPIVKPDDDPDNAFFRQEMPWRTLSRVEHPDIKEANQQLLQDLEQGADGTIIVHKGAGSGHGFGIDIDTQEKLQALLEGVFVDATHLRFEGFKTSQLSLWLSFCESRNYDPQNLSVSFGLQPGLKDRPTDFSQLPDASSSNACWFTADGAHWHNSGASAAQELGLVLAQMVDFLRQDSNSQFDLSAAARMIDVKLSCDADQFETLSKFRAMRALWAQVLASCELENVPLSIHAETSWRMMSRRDPWTNILRTTLASFSAALGGADSIAVLPHTQALGLPDPFARRIARNTSLILQEESHLNRVVDPAAGAGLFDSFSNALAEEAWNIFQDIEASRGWAKAFASGTPQELFAKTKIVRQDKIAKRKTVSLGNSHFSKLDEKPVAVLMELPLETNPSAGFVYMRDGLPFEQLAARADMLALNQRPAVALICLGDPKNYKARESFAADFFASAGLHCVSHVVKEPSDLDDFIADETPIACLCGSDDTYAASANDLLTQLKSQGARHCLVAGRENYASADGNIYLGVNAVEALDTILTVFEGANQ